MLKYNEQPIFYYQLKSLGQIGWYMQINMVSELEISMLNFVFGEPHTWCAKMYPISTFLPLIGQRMVAVVWYSDDRVIGSAMSIGMSASSAQCSTQMVA